MRITALPFLALATAVSAVDGSWNVTRTYTDISQQVIGFSLTAVFISEAYPFPGLESKCYREQKGLPDQISCTPSSFSLKYNFDGTFELKQVIEKPTNQTVFGQTTLPNNGWVVVDVKAATA